MKKKIALLIVCMIVVLLVPVVFTNDSAFAGDCNGVETNIIDCKGEDPICHVLNLIVEIMSIGIGVLAAIGIAVTGVQYLSSGGNEEKARKAKRRMYELVIGLVLFAGLASIVAWLNPGGLFCGGNSSGSGGSLGAETCFKDVRENAVYQEAICWAKQKGIAQGDGEYFKPGEGLKRSEGITFVWRLAGQPNASGSGGCSIDSSERDKYYYTAVKWGCSKDIFKGTNNGLELNGGLKARQFVTMLYRYKFSDDGWEDKAMEWANQDSDLKNSGILNNNGYKTITRGEAMNIVYELFGK